LAEHQGVNVDRLWGALRNLVLRTVLAGEGPINAMTKLNVNSKYNCYELFGVDVILDSELVPWLLEVNISPSLHSSSPLDLHVKGPLVTAVLNTAMYQVRVTISSTRTFGECIFSFFFKDSSKNSVSSTSRNSN
jgi:tubulin polyglutamylase TTLL4